MEVRNQTKSGRREKIIEASYLNYFYENTCENGRTTLNYQRCKYLINLTPTKPSIGKGTSHKEIRGARSMSSL